jgi:hypothetical protein
VPDQDYNQGAEEERREHPESNRKSRAARNFSFLMRGAEFPNQQVRCRRKGKRQQQASQDISN